MDIETWYPPACFTRRFPTASGDWSFSRHPPRTSIVRWPGTGIVFTAGHSPAGGQW